MVDVVSPATRSRMMAAIRGRDTKPELHLRLQLHAAGYRFRLHCRDLPGRPDIVLPRRRAVILVHGCYWHRHEGCRYCTTPSSNQLFWKAKFDANVARDERTVQALRVAGWRVAIVWECAIAVDGLSAPQFRRLAGWLDRQPSTVSASSRVLVLP